LAAMLTFHFLFADYTRKRRFLVRNPISPIRQQPNEFAVRNASSSAVPFQGWSVEINPVRSAERDVRCWYDPPGGCESTLCACEALALPVEDPPLMSRVLPQRI
jgi:hypothetical protein